MPCRVRVLHRGWKLEKSYCENTKKPAFSDSTPDPNPLTLTYYRKKSSKEQELENRDLEIGNASRTSKDCIISQNRVRKSFYPLKVLNFVICMYLWGVAVLELDSHPHHHK